MMYTNNIGASVQAAIIISYFQSNGELLSLPEDTIAVVGQDVHLRCKTNLTEPVRWTHTPVGTTDMCPVYWGNGIVVESYKDRFSVTPSDGYMNLTIRDVQPDDAGCYTCADLGGDGIDTGDYGSANLTVLDKEEENSITTTIEVNQSEKFTSSTDQGISTVSSRTIEELCALKLSSIRSMTVVNLIVFTLILLIAFIMTGKLIYQSVTRRCKSQVDETSVEDDDLLSQKKNLSMA